LGVFDVPAGSLIKEIAADLKKQGLKSPDWSLFVKTGPSRERAADSPDWFFERAASILYRIYKQGPLGTESLRRPAARLSGFVCRSLRKTAL